MFMQRMFRYDTEGGGGGGEGSGSGGSGGSDPVQASFNNLLQRYQNDAMQLAMQLFSENYGLREERRQLRDQVTQLQTRVPKEGAVTLSAEDAQTWEAYKQLGDPKDLQASQGELVQLKRGRVIQQAAGAAGYRASVLEKLSQDLEFEMTQETVDGQSVEVPYVVYQGAKTKLTEFAEKNWPEFLPSLLPSETESSQGVAFVEQPTGRKPQKKDVVSERIALRQEQRTKSKNPLMP